MANAVCARLMLILVINTMVMDAIHTMKTASKKTYRQENGECVRCKRKLASTGEIEMKSHEKCLYKPFLHYPGENK